MLELLDTGGIPYNILVGKKRGYTSVWTIYRSRFTEKFMELLNKSFWDRSEEGNADDLGNHWKPLAKKTKEQKVRDIENGAGTAGHTNDFRFGTQYNAGVPGGNKQNYGTMTPNQRAAYDLIYQREFKKAQKAGNSDKSARRLANAAAIQKMRGKKPDLDTTQVPINIRTGRLVAATSPGVVVANRYYPPTSDQNVAVDEEYITIDFTSIPYAPGVDGQRQIIPDNAGEWVLECHMYALEFAREEYDRIESGKESPIILARRREKRRIEKHNRDLDIPF